MGGYAVSLPPKCSRGVFEKLCQFNWQEFVAIEDIGFSVRSSRIALSDHPFRAGNPWPVLGR
ncbi:hypothetical protein [Acetobacter senegalensis]|uniref:hypothetical protein n=1 Tax=Acetobacter senegalensis TaxID=446692 RepID=UPI0011200300|nr:hypothetical protein [Acetobacter senegalensis]